MRRCGLTSMRVLCWIEAVLLLLIFFDKVL